MLKYMDRYGFNSDPQLDYPSGQMIPSGLYGPTDFLPQSAPVDIGRVAIGQANLRSRLLQMAEVAARSPTRACSRSRPSSSRLSDPDGRTISSLSPQAQSTVMSPKTASELTSMMTKVTQEGTAAGLTVQGLPFAGKDRHR